MYVRRVVIASLVQLLVLASALLGAPAHASYPTPDADPFYAPPTGYASRSNGTVLRSRSITATTLGVPLAARATQLLYRTTDATGSPTAEVTTVMVPLTPWLGQGSRPVVSYQTAEDSVDSRCSPSYALRAGLSAATSNAASETTIMASLLARGWAVVTSDYQGPNSHFLAGPQEGKGVLDGIRAARSSGFGGLTAQNPVGLWGYSGGAFATAWAIQQQPSYAPELTFVGSALGGIPADLEPAMRVIDGGSAPAS